MTVRVENVEEHPKEHPKETRKEHPKDQDEQDEGAPVPKKRGRPLGAKDKKKRTVRVKEDPPMEARQPPMDSPPVPRPVPSYQDQKRAYLRQMADLRKAEYDARVQRFAAMIEKTLPY